MNAPVRPVRPVAVQPIGVDVFDRDRKDFLRSFAEFMRDPLVPTSIRDEEFRATIRALSQIAALIEVG